MRGSTLRHVPPAHLRRALAGAALATALLAPRGASAFDVLAVSCDDDPLYCQRGAMLFDHTDALPVEFDFDTGWVPQNSPLMVHIWAAVYANTRVSLEGDLVTVWPDAFDLTAPGAVDGGAFSYHYGVDVGAQAQINISVGGQTYTWTGDIPYVPQVDIQVQAEEQFDAWAFAPGVSMASATQPQQLVQVSIADLVGASIPGIDGGFELDVALEVEATYETHRIVVADSDGPVPGGDITSPDGATSTPYLGGAFVELDVHPEGSVKYDGVIHLIPAFYVELLGQNWQIPIADIPIPFPITENEWVFDAQRVHVPLPDLVLPEAEIDFGRVEVGQKNLETYPVFNAGEALLGATVTSEDPENFEVFEPALEVEPGATVDSSIRFVPKKNGDFEALIHVASNDPSDPVQAFLVRGTGYGGPEDAPDDGPMVEDDGSCACRAAGGGRRGDAGAGAAMAALAAAALAARGRRRRDA